MRTDEEMQSAFLSIRDDVDVVRSYLRVMGDLVTNGGRPPAPGQPALVEIEAEALEVVLHDLATRCGRVADFSDSLEMEFPLGGRVSPSADPGQRVATLATGGSA